MNLRIRDLREDRDLTQQQVAQYLMCDQSLYSKYERGERSLPLEFADRLAGFYGISVDYLLGRTNHKKPYPQKVKRTCFPWQVRFDVVRWSTVPKGQFPALS